MEIDVIEYNEKYNYKVGLSKDKKIKLFTSPAANYSFNLVTGAMYSWGRNLQEDPANFPVPSILDMEITTKCTGINGKVCPYCYKANTAIGRNMSFETFKHIIDVYPKSLTQVALGADATLKSNPDIWDMMEYCRENFIVPNVTAVDIDDETADKLAKYCGAVAISYHENLDVCANSVKKLTDRGMTQVNMHLVIYNENFDECMNVLKAVKEDSRFEKLNAVVMLSLKQKGRATKGYTALSQEKFNALCEYAKDSKIGIGFDSCSSLKAMRAFDESVRNSIIPCEAAGQESSYINVDGFYFPCSFCEGFKDNRVDWTKGLNVLECNSIDDFIEKIWRNEKTLFSGKLLKETEKCNELNCKECPFYKI